MKRKIEIWYLPRDVNHGHSAIFKGSYEVSDWSELKSFIRNLDDNFLDEDIEKFWKGEIQEMVGLRYWIIERCR